MKWYLKKRSVVIAFLLVGPLALPLVWMRKMNLFWKVGVTIIALIGSWLLGHITVQSLGGVLGFLLQIS